MASRTRRKLQVVGAGGESLAITLPKGWVQFWELKGKQVVDVVYADVVMIFPEENKKLEEKVLEFFRE